MLAYLHVLHTDTQEKETKYYLNVVLSIIRVCLAVTVSDVLCSFSRENWRTGAPNPMKLCTILADRALRSNIGLYTAALNFHRFKMAPFV